MMYVRRSLSLHLLHARKLESEPRQDPDFTYVSMVLYFISMGRFLPSRYTASYRLDPNAGKVGFRLDPKAIIGAFPITRPFFFYSPNKFSFFIHSSSPSIFAFAFVQTFEYYLLYLISATLLLLSQIT